MVLNFIFVLGFATTFAGKNPVIADPELVAYINKIDEKNASVQTLTADFIQRKEISLLKEPIEMRGTFSLKRNQGMRFDFESKEDLILILTPERVVALSPKAKKAQEIKMKKHRVLPTQVISDQLRNLLDYFTIKRSNAPDKNGDRYLVLKPTRRKLKKMFQEIQIWTNDQYLVHKLRVVSKDGDVYQLTLSNIQINSELASDPFKTDIPKGYTMDKRIDDLLGSEIGL